MKGLLVAALAAVAVVAAVLVVFDRREPAPSVQTAAPAISAAPESVPLPKPRKAHAPSLVRRDKPSPQPYSCADVRWWAQNFSSEQLESIAKSSGLTANQIRNAQSCLGRKRGGPK